MERVINGLKINYKIIGEGKPLLILHGWGSNSERWQKIGELLAEKEIKVIIPDLPGFGKSQIPSIIWGLDDYCKFVEEFAKNLGLDKFILLGHSFGGALAAKYSLKFPKKIEKLFLVAAACFRRKSFKKKFFYFISKIFKVFYFLPGYSKIRKAFYKFIVRKSDYFYTEGVMKEIYLKIIKEDLLKELAKIQIPAFIIWGEKDDITKLKEGYLINKKIKKSHLEVLAGCNHDLNIKTPEKLVKTIIQFLF